MSVSTVAHIPHPSAPVEVWRDDTAAPVVGMYVGYPGRDDDEAVYIPVEVARQVAAAILATVTD